MNRLHYKQTTPLARRVTGVCESVAKGRASLSYCEPISPLPLPPHHQLAATAYPPEYIDQIPLTDMGLTSPPGRTYLHYTGKQRRQRN
jgi:hypothetical protein